MGLKSSVRQSVGFVLAFQQTGSCAVTARSLALPLVLLPLAMPRGKRVQEPAAVAEAQPSLPLLDAVPDGLHSKRSQRVVDFTSKVHIASGFLRTECLLG